MTCLHCSFNDYKSQSVLSIISSNCSDVYILLYVCRQVWILWIEVSGYSIPWPNAKWIKYSMHLIYPLHTLMMLLNMIIEIIRLSRFSFTFFVCLFIYIYREIIWKQFPASISAVSEWANIIVISFYRQYENSNLLQSFKCNANQFFFSFFSS